MRLHFTGPVYDNGGAALSYYDGRGLEWEESVWPHNTDVMARYKHLEPSLELEIKRK
jgi:hypothetical protein